MEVNNILSTYAAYFAWEAIASATYCVILFFWRKHFPEIFDIFETLVVGIWAFYTMLILSPVIPAQYWYTIATGLIVSATPITVFSLVSKGYHYRRILKGVEDAKSQGE